MSYQTSTPSSRTLPSILANVLHKLLTPKSRSFLYSVNSEEITSQYKFLKPLSHTLTFFNFLTSSNTSMHLRNRNQPHQSLHSSPLIKHFKMTIPISLSIKFPFQSLLFPLHRLPSPSLQEHS